MNPIIPGIKSTPNIALNGHANLDIKLDGWPGVTAVGIIGATLIAITALFLKFKP